jgi:hypothetical protein
MSRMVQYCDGCLRIIDGAGAFNLKTNQAYHIGCAPPSFQAKPAAVKPPRPDIRESPPAFDQREKPPVGRPFEGSIAAARREVLRAWNRPELDDALANFERLVREGASIEARQANLAIVEAIRVNAEQLATRLGVAL